MIPKLVIDADDIDIWWTTNVYDLIASILRGLT